MMLSHQLRRFSSYIAIIAIILSSVPQTFGAEFPDTRNTVYEDAFRYLKDRSIVQGYSDGYARPSNPLNRVEALKVILIAKGDFQDRIAHYSRKMPSMPLFRDISQSEWYGPYVETAFEQGVITGYPDSTFRPARLLSTEEAVTMLMRTFAIEGDGQNAELSPYIENKPNAWFTSSINAAIERNLIMHSGRIELGRSITRGEFFDMVYRLLYAEARNAIAYRGAEPYNPSIQISENRETEISVQPQSYTENESYLAVETYDNNDVPAEYYQPENVQIAPRINHEHASEKHFAISMPSIGIHDLTITHPVDPSTKEGVLDVLSEGVGHLFSYPGGEGKIMIYGHSSGYPWDVSQYTKIFRKINELAPGDRVYVTYNGKLHIYEVTHEQTIIATDANRAFQDEGTGEELILFTCWPPDSIAQRYLVHAVPVDTIAAQ